MRKRGAIRRQACVVIGRSNIVGKPQALMLLEKNASVTIVHSRTTDLAEHTRRADILVAAVGRAKMVKADMVKPGAVVIDVAMNRNEAGKLCGDVDFPAVKEVASRHYPRPRRRWPHDPRHADEKHRQGGPPAKRAVSARHMGRKTAPHREKNTCMGQIFVV